MTNAGGRWAPNPIALARTVLGAVPGGRRWPHSWGDTEDLLAEAFKADARSVFYGNDTVPAVLDVIRDIEASASHARSLEAVLALPEVQKLAAYVTHEEALARVLPFIVPIDGAGFGPPGTGFRLLRRPPPIGAYEEIGALDVAGVSWLDPEQGNVADCYLISAMIAIAWARPVRWFERLSAATQGSKEPNTLRVTFHAESEGDAQPRAFDVPPRVPLDAGRNWIYAHSAQSEETWPALLERAFVMHACDKRDGEPTVDDYRTIGTERHWPHDVARALIGGSAHSRSGEHDGSLAAALLPLCEARITRHPAMAWTHDRSERRDWPDSGLVANHAYAVLGLLSRGHRDYVVLRNPYGKNAHHAHFARGEWSEGAPRNDGQPVALDEHGVFAIDDDAFDRWFTKIGWVEVPRDPGGE